MRCARPCSKWARGSRSTARQSTRPRLGRPLAKVQRKLKRGHSTTPTLNLTQPKTFVSQPREATSTSSEWLVPPTAKPLSIRSAGRTKARPSPIAKVELLGSAEKVTWTQGRECARDHTACGRSLQVCLRAEADSSGKVGVRSLGRSEGSRGRMMCLRNVLTRGVHHVSQPSPFCRSSRIKCRCLDSRALCVRSRANRCQSVGSGTRPSSPGVPSTTAS